MIDQLKLQSDLLQKLTLNLTSQSNLTHSDLQIQSQNVLNSSDYGSVRSDEFINNDQVDLIDKINEPVIVKMEKPKRTKSTDDLSAWLSQHLELVYRVYRNEVSITGFHKEITDAGLNLSRPTVSKIYKNILGGTYDNLLEPGFDRTQRTPRRGRPIKLN